MPTNLFPVNMQVGDERFDQVRFYGTPEYSEVWGLVAGKPAVVATGAGLVKQSRAMGGETFADGAKAKWTLPLIDGVVWLCSPGAGCGCSHPLKRFDPSKAVRA